MEKIDKNAVRTIFFIGCCPHPVALSFIIMPSNDGCSDVAVVVAGGAAVVVLAIELCKRISSGIVINVSKTKREVLLMYICC